MSFVLFNAPYNPVRFMYENRPVSSQSLILRFIARKIRYFSFDFTVLYKDKKSPTSIKHVSFSNIKKRERIYLQELVEEREEGPCPPQQQSQHGFSCVHIEAPLVLILMRKQEQ